MKYSFSIFPFFILFIMISYHQVFAQSSIALDLSNEIVIPKQYVVYHTEQSMTIDGKADEEIWEIIPFTSNFVDIEGVKLPKFNTMCKMLWDDDYLYIYAEMEDPHVAANLLEHDTIIYFDKDFEVFIDPDDDTYQYFELEINALNTTWDLFLDRPYRAGGRALNEFEMKGLQHAVSINGTLNDATDTDEGWSVELAIPIDVILKKRGDKIQDDDYWRMNFSRVHWDQDFIKGKYRNRKDGSGKLLEEYNWVWSNQKVINMHEPEKWGYVIFSKNHPSVGAFVDLPSDLCDRQIAFACYRMTRQKQWKYLKNEKQGFRQKFEQVACQGDQYEITFIKTFSGFEFIIRNLATGRMYVIDELGIFKKIK